VVLVIVQPQYATGRDPIALASVFGLTDETKRNLINTRIEQGRPPVQRVHSITAHSAKKRSRRIRAPSRNLEGLLCADKRTSRGAVTKSERCQSATSRTVETDFNHFLIYKLFANRGQM
jgi:hypothetical protein